ncbi:hypothetical protein GOV09_02480 [Candidatus Woesearchaeota archaeon]|nr:hypothetical protein [Candidatus Woesearchaeota archaeon]
MNAKERNGVYGPRMLRPVNKKGFGIKLFIEVLFFVLLSFIAWKIFIMLTGYWVQDLETGTRSSLERLQIEIDNMVKIEEQIPMYIDEIHEIQGFTKGISQLGCTSTKSCVCICIKDSNCQNKALKKCIELEKALVEDFRAEPKLDEENAVTYTCTLRKSEKGVNVYC